MPVVYGANTSLRFRLCDQYCFTLPALSAKGVRLETSTYPDRERAAL